MYVHILDMVVHLLSSCSLLSIRAHSHAWLDSNRVFVLIVHICWRSLQINSALDDLLEDFNWTLVSENVLPVELTRGTDPFLEYKELAEDVSSLPVSRD